MSKLLKAAQAGTVESSDILISLMPAEAATGIQVELVSPTLQQYGKHIKNLIIETLVFHGIEDVQVYANDKGALDCTIKARVKTALERAGE
ncbi:citrate lyase acyl carrier protein [Pelosinus propionicus]|uniref:Citrate lyase subunit gamma (Acyl carrier protein) n=1 Tax=Pelosinus propionicus DSM 13327 TaxID=1123291 RepID=A0A1I4NK99_9FIRM|nr:citrate lyase acyl carrier protein [Pelosinus propionicus]SFM15899.1 citrate lyase subunit gamma (acyl carrier protein) [Pelosinus propionicus DSM 13327]